MADTVRKPQQQRAIEKKNRIITAGFKLFAEKGYYNTNTAEIAKEAGVSTGIVYGYFRDKRDILVEVLDLYIDHVFNPIFALFDNITPPLDYDYIIGNTVDSVVTTHKNNAAIHEALNSLSHTDEAIRRKFMSLEDEMTMRLVDKLTLCGLEPDLLPEKVHLAIQTVESYAHECVYDKHTYLSYADMRKLVIRMLKTIFTD